MPSTKPRRNVYLSNEVLQMALLKCKETGLSFSALVNVAVVQYCKLDSKMIVNHVINGRRHDD